MLDNRLSVSHFLLRTGVWLPWWLTRGSNLSLLAEIPVGGEEHEGDGLIGGLDGQDGEGQPVLVD